MLGYVQIFKPELKVREYEIYMGYYCGVCKYIGKTYGQLPRMVLSYDAAFLALLLACVDETPDAPVQEHCVMHHIKNKTIIRNAAIEYAGDVMLILAWYKMLDDANDEGKLYAKASARLLKRLHRKLVQKYPALCDGIEINLAKLNGLEKARCASLDEAAESFSKIMEVIFREGARLLYPTSQHLHETFGRTGYHMGKWIYLIDAADDIEENIESGAYNPLLYRFAYRGAVGGDTAGGAEGDTTGATDCDAAGVVDSDTIGAAEPESPQQFRERIRGNLEFNLYQYLAVLSQQTGSLDIRKNQGIIDNVIYFGMNRKTEEILNKTDKGESDESI